MERLKTFFSRLSTAQVISLAVLLLLIAVVPVLVAFNRQQQTTSQQAALITNPICTTICPSPGLGIACRIICNSPVPTVTGTLPPPSGCTPICPSPGLGIPCRVCTTPPASSCGKILQLSSPIQLDKTTVAIGETIHGTATFTNISTCTVQGQIMSIGTCPAATITNGAAGCHIFAPEIDNFTVAPGQSITTSGSFTPSSTDPAGQWGAYPAYLTDTWHDNEPPDNLPQVFYNVINSSVLSPTPPGCIRVCPTCIPGGICPQFACFLRCPTPTPSGGTPTLNPSPSVSPITGGTQLAFTIFLGGIGNAGDNSNPNATGNQNPNRTQRTLTVFLFDGNGQPVTQATGPINYVSANGNFTGTIGINNLPSGNYIVKVKTDQFLRKQLPGILHIDGQQTNTMPSVTLIAGDIAPVPQGDNALSLLDYNILIGCFSDLQPAQSCTDAQKLSADLNDDGKVNEVDYNEFLRNLAVQNGD